MENKESTLPDFIQVAYETNKKGTSNFTIPYYI